MHTKLLSPARAEEVREKIRATLIVKKLEDHVLEGAEMTSTQIQAALGLLKKAVPDLAAMSVELGNKDGEAFVQKVIREIVRTPDRDAGSV